MAQLDDTLQVSVGEWAKGNPAIFLKKPREVRLGDFVKANGFKARTCSPLAIKYTMR